MKKMEWLRLFLVFVATNGWWAFATWPTINGGKTLSPLILVGLLPMITGFCWFLSWVFDLNNTEE